MRTFILLALMLLGSCFGKESVDTPELQAMEVKSLNELMRLAEGHDQVIRLVPGKYYLSDLATKKWIKSQQNSGESRFMEFSGDGNRYLMEGAAIEWDTDLRRRMNAPVHSGEIVVTGARNIFEGLEIRCVGDGASRGGALLEVLGEDNELKGLRLEIKGSKPYGYGDLFGKGARIVIRHFKHSGIRVAADGTRLKGCKVVMRAFGHAIFLQEDASDVLIEDCHVRGEVRKSEEILAERKGAAYENKFRTVLKMRGGKNRVLPGYMKSLCEDGFRTYGQHKGLVIRNCTATNVRGGFEIRMDEPVLIENSAAIGCERGFWVSSGAIVRKCRADARYGPALFIEGEGAKVELHVLPDFSDRKVHGLAMIGGHGHEIQLKTSGFKPRRVESPIWIGYSAPSAGEGMAQFGEEQAKKVKLRNETNMPVIIGKRASDLTLLTSGKVKKNSGKRVKITKI